jgi:CheY-like chemotaxis protein/heterodisulfide reductase subunit C
MEIKGKVLVVDDEEVVLRSVDRILTKEKHAVETVLTAEAALMKVGDTKYDIIVTDWKMPGIDGMELIARIKELQPDTRIIMITGYSSVDSAVKAMSLGAFDYISKPFTPKDIALAVEKGLKDRKTVEAVIAKKDIGPFLEKLSARFAIYGPRRKGASFVFDNIERPGDLVLEYTSTILPLKKYFIPQEEVLVEFDLDKKRISAPDVPEEKRLFFGIHPCDMQAVLKLDYAFSRGNIESNYMRRRRNTFFVGVSCRPDKDCFCESVGSYVTNEGFDLFLVDIGDRYFVEVVTDTGRDLLWSCARISEPDEADRKMATQTKNRNRKYQIPLGCHTLALPELLEVAYDNDFWSETAKKCLSCGTCNLVCPTCYCFDVTDRLNLNLRDGRRLRRWDACMLETFASVATGENFRKEAKDRLRHRMNRKYLYETAAYGKCSCVGCGRCTRACVAGIDIKQAVNALAERHREQLQGFMEYAIMPGKEKTKE